ncbi:TIGR01244 family phosphatase [Sphingomonas sp. CGMCC 1.13654]|uniref:TIGR01244 family phosphatase n=1 Tax=Sphingomonas chungangi TaxID=2683589 RepID=A0A838L0G7_9SPHN|nr:TIGR01244 family sulfur transferase [Sphingomonas chungangi]MBA2932537.1 TIGR01244 family phosphatase [Sphingomonas chungangi]MVW56160.1 TIGR01244 family phosphatase [Sphingomonas chungangi]
MAKWLDETIAVSPQISVEEVAEAQAEGIRTIINNRPDGEQAGQPTAAEIGAAAKAAGLGYVHIPVDHSGFSMDQVEAMTAALAGPGPVLAFCRSGTRSTYLWSLARGAAGDEPSEIAAKAANAGYDVSGLIPMIESLRPKN